MNFFDILLAKKLEDDRDPRVEGLSVTANGRYEETGVVYTPVIVNVPYDFDKKSLTNQPVASFSDAMNAPLYDLDIDIDPVQDLHGYANPWVGGAGKNLFTPNEWHRAYNVGTNLLIVGDDSIFVKAGTYTLSFEYYNDDAPALNSYWRIYNDKVTYADVSKQIQYGVLGIVTSATEWTSKTMTITIEQDGYFGIDDGQLRGGVYYRNIQLEAGSSPTAYEPYANICPISGWTGANVTTCGKNIFDVNHIYEVTINGAAGPYDRYGVKFTKPGTYYAESKNTNNAYIYARINYADGTQSETYYLQRGTTIDPMTTFTLTSGQSLIIYNASADSEATTKTLMEKVVVGYGAALTDFEEYTGETYNISFGAAGTVYDGILDITSGVLTVTMASVDLGTLNWVTPTAGGRTTASLGGRPAESGTSIANAYCDIYNIITPMAWYNTSEIGIAMLGAGYGGNGSVGISDTGFDGKSTTEVANALDGHQLVYELATPQTYQLTPEEIKTIFDQQNNIYADTGNVANVTYLAVASE